MRNLILLLVVLVVVVACPAGAQRHARGHLGDGYPPHLYLWDQAELNAHLLEASVRDAARYADRKGAIALSAAAVVDASPQVVTAPEPGAPEAETTATSDRLIDPSPESGPQYEASSISDGTAVGYAPVPSSGRSSSGERVSVSGYTRKDGTVVQPYTRSAPRSRR